MDKWSVIGVASSVPNSGDAQPYSLLGIPLIILRDKKKKIRVFHNVCSHRGFKLIDEPCSLKNVLRCPYHSWAYDFDGKLVATPHIGGLNTHEIENFDKSFSNLKEVRTKVWMDIIFVNINNNELEFEEYIKPLEERWSKFISKEDQNLIKYSKDHGYFNLDVKCNWKFAIENYCESYHLPWIHPELNKVSNINKTYHNFIDDAVVYGHNTIYTNDTTKVTKINKPVSFNGDNYFTKEIEHTSNITNITGHNNNNYEHNVKIINIWSILIIMVLK